MAGVEDAPGAIFAGVDGFEEGEGVVCTGTIVDDDELGVGPVDGAIERIETGGEERGLVTRGDDNRDRVFREKLSIPFELVKAEGVFLHQGRQHHFGAVAATGDGVDDSAAGGVEQVAFLVAALGGARLVGTPMVADERHVDDIGVIDVFDAAEDEIDVLSALVSDAETADLGDDGAPDRAEVVGVIVSDRHLGIPVALELGVVVATGGVDFVFVSVEEVGGGVSGNGLGDMEEGVGGEDIVVIEEGNVLAGSEFEGGVGRGGYVAVGFAHGKLDAGIRLGGGAEFFNDVLVGRAVIGEAEFPVGVDLGFDAVDELVEELGRRIIGGDDDADLGTGGADGFGLGVEEFQQAGGELVVMEPEIVGLLALPRRGRWRRGGLAAANHFIGEFDASATDRLPELGPAFQIVFPADDFSNHASHDANEFEVAVVRDGAGVFVEFVDEQALGAEELAGAVRVVDEDLQAGRAERFGADIDEAIEGGFQCLRESGIVAEHVLALFAPHEAVFIDAANAGMKARDLLIFREGPAGDPEFFVVRVDPEVGEIEVADEVVLREHLGLIDRNLVEHAHGFGFKGRA